MKIDSKKIQEFSQKQLDLIYADPGYKELLAQLCGIDPNFALVNESVFGMEFVAMRLAVGCRAWERACDENLLKEEIYRKMFLRTVMESFKTPKVLNIATAFGDYLFTLDAEETGPIIPIVQQMFKRLKIDETLGDGKATQINHAFEVLVLVCEGHRTYFESQFMEFLPF